MVDKLSAEQIVEFKKAFAFFDKDGNGSITADEVSSVMVSLGLDPSTVDLRKCIDEVDGDGSGGIDMDEFIEMMATTLLGSDSDTSSDTSCTEDDEDEEEDDKDEVTMEKKCVEAEVKGGDDVAENTAKTVKKKEETVEETKEQEEEPENPVTILVSEEEPSLFDAFRTFDKDGDGFVSADEIRQVTAELGDKFTDKEVEDMISDADADGDGQIDYEEFARMMEGK